MVRRNGVYIYMYIYTHPITPDPCSHEVTLDTGQGSNDMSSKLIDVELFDVSKISQPSVPPCVLIPAVLIKFLGLFQGKGRTPRRLLVNNSVVY